MKGFFVPSVPLPIIADTYLWTVNYKVGTAPMANVLCFQKASSTAAVVNGNVWTAWNATNSWQSLQSNTVDYLSSYCLPLDGSGMADIVNRTTTHGGTSAPAVSPQTCLILTLRTALRGKSHRGRMYLGGISNLLLGTPTTQWSSTGMTGFNAAIGAWNVSLGTSNTVQCVLSRHLGVATPVSNVVARQYLGSQRDRAESQM